MACVFSPKDGLLLPLTWTKVHGMMAGMARHLQSDALATLLSPQRGQAGQAFPALIYWPRESHTADRAARSDKKRLNWKNRTRVDQNMRGCGRDLRGTAKSSTACPMPTTRPRRPRWRCTNIAGSFRRDNRRSIPVLKRDGAALDDALQGPQRQLLSFVKRDDDLLFGRGIPPFFDGCPWCQPR